jgi:hypothetical protein
VIALGSVLGVWVGIRSSRGRRRKDLVLLMAALLGFILLATIAYRSMGILVDIIYPSVALVLSYSVLLELRRRWSP